MNYECKGQFKFFWEKYNWKGWRMKKWMEKYPKDRQMCVLTYVFQLDSNVLALLIHRFLFEATTKFMLLWWCVILMYWWSLSLSPSLNLNQHQHEKEKCTCMYQKVRQEQTLFNCFIFFLSCYSRKCLCWKYKFN